MIKLKLFLLIIFLFPNFSITAQLKNTPGRKAIEQDVIQYLEQNLAKLDPLEGIYSVTEEIIVHDSYGNTERVVNPPYSCYIYKVTPTMLTAISYDSDFGISEITRIGKSNSYRIKVDLSAITEFKKNNNSDITHGNLENHPYEGFTVQTNINDKRYHVRMELLNHFKKSYPLESDIRSASIAEVESEPTSWTGTGFAIGGGYIVTNNHVINGADEITIIEPSTKEEYDAKVIANDKSNDLAIIHISDTDFNGYNKLPYGIDVNLGNIGESIFVLGYPLTSSMGEQIKTTNGIISSLSGYDDDYAMYQISAPIQPGNSGGPLFDTKGNIIGIVCAKHTKAENAGYAVKSSYLQNLVKSAGIKIPISSINRISHLTLPQQIKKIQNYVYLIKCSK